MEVLHSQSTTSYTKQQITRLLTPYALLFIFCLSLLSCQEEKDELPFQVLYSNNTLAIDDLIIDGNALIGVGGDTWEKGISLNHNLDNGETTLETVSNKRIFTLFKDGEQIKAAGVDARIYENLQEQSEWPIRKLPAWGIIKDVIKTSTGYVAIGGKSFKNGYIYLLDQEMNWVEEIEVDQELTAIEKGQENTYIISAFGGLMSLDANNNINLLPNKGDFFTDLAITYRSGLCIGSNGTLLKSEDMGQTWSTLTEGNQLLRENDQWNTILSVPDGWIIGGRNGHISLITREHEVLKRWKVDQDIDILSLALYGPRLFIGGRFGEIGYVELP